MKYTLNFLKELKTNNNKDWFEKNKNTYLQSKEAVEALVNKVITGVRKFDKQIAPDLKGKDCTFRIYKDVHFLQ